MPDSGPLDSADPLLASLQALPVGVHMILGVGLAAGFVLWLAGQRVVRPIFAVIGLVFGAAVGFFLAPLLAVEPVNGIPTPYLGMGAGGLLGLGGAVALFRFSMAAAAGIVVSIASMMGMAIHLEQAGSEGRVWASVEDDSESDWRGMGSFEDSTGDSPDEVSRLAREAADRTREFLGRARAAAGARWERVPEDHRLMVAGAGLGGGMLGFLFGVFVPRRASAVVTALFGSALWMACGVWTAHATGAPGLAILEQPARVWMMVWGATAAFGIIVQCVGIARRTRKAD